MLRSYYGKNSSRSKDPVTKTQRRGATKTCPQQRGHCAHHAKAKVAGYSMLCPAEGKGVESAKLAFPGTANHPGQAIADVAKANVTPCNVGYFISG